MPIKILRSAATKNGFTNAGSAKLHQRSQGPTVVFRLDVPGGKTDVECIIEPDAFAKFADYMMAAHPVAATRAFGKALAGRDYGVRIK